MSTDYEDPLSATLSILPLQHTDLMDVILELDVRGVYLWSWSYFLKTGNVR
jgi:hypothetical protein